MSRSIGDSATLVAICRCGRCWLSTLVGRVGLSMLVHPADNQCWLSTLVDTRLCWPSNLVGRVGLLMLVVNFGRSSGFVDVVGSPC